MPVVPPNTLPKLGIYPYGTLVVVVEGNNRPTTTTSGVVVIMR